MHGDLLLRLNMAVFDYAVVTSGTSAGAGDGSSADEAPQTPEAPSPNPTQPPSQNVREVWDNLLVTPNTP